MLMTNTIQVVIADDHPMILLGTSLAIENCPKAKLVGQAHNSTELMSLLEKVECNVLVTDLAMPGGIYGDGLQLISLVKRRFSHIRIVVHTMIENPAILKQLKEIGVLCVLSKSDDMSHINAAVNHAANNCRYIGPAAKRAFESAGFYQSDEHASATLSKRETEVVRLFVGGSTIKEIADQLNRSVKTISTQKKCAMQKLGLKRDADLFHYAQVNGLINFPASKPALDTEIKDSISL